MATKAQAALEEFQKSMKDSWTEFLAEQQRQQNEFRDKMRAQRDTMLRITNQFQEIGTKVTTLERNALNNGGHLNNNNGGQQFNSSFARFSKIEFPRFNGEDVQGWVYRCEQFFEVDSTNEDLKVKLVSIHLEGKALLWHQSLMKTNLQGLWPVWGVYKAAILARFGSQPYDDPISELMNLKHSGTVEAYQEKFDALLIRTDLSEKQAISCFLSGLQPDIQSTVRMFKPQTLIDAYTLARLQENTLSCINKRNKPLLEKPVTKSFTSYQPQNSPKPLSNPNVQFKTTRQRLTPEFIAERRAKNLCFFCPEKFVAGHKCPAQLHCIEVVTVTEDETVGESEVSELWQQESSGDELPPLISLNAITGNAAFQTMKVTGKVRGTSLNILIDSGSTHNFLDENTARKLGCKVVPSYPVAVSVANGESIYSKNVVKQFSWQLQGETFQTDIMLVPLGTCDMVLGVQWLSSLGPVLWDFKQLRMQFQYKGKKHVLRGGKRAGVDWVNGKQLQSLIVKGISTGCSPQLFALSIQSTEELTTSEGNPVPTAVQTILDDFKDVFKTPTELPPHRTYDHTIHLKEGTTPINVRPYRYPVVQKDAIESIVKEMLESGVVRPSQSPFSSPIVLVKNKDGTWRLCVDYRELNKYTVKDKFPIPVIEELLDELHGLCDFF
ncbi:uncharacterized protein LOC141587757 [Silene latifolia]|uniref:uncharacterized protein LOC141587757 n=1 Tax=Silene latifolia TaxID=37657 RepID=UPI003D785737